MASLLKSKKFAPFFWTQFFGAFNDNVYKNALLILIAFNSGSESESGLLVNVASGLFILPFLLFSPLAGQIADKYEKSKLIQLIKIAEIVIMALGAVAFWYNSIAALILVLFLMGSQSTFFGPVKYSILPQHLKETELMSGTSFIEMGTFIAILIGTICGGFFIKSGASVTAVAVVVFAILGTIVSYRIPKAEAADSKLKLNYDPISEIKNMIVIAKQSDSIYLSIVGISWAWFLGAIVLAQLPTFAKHTLHADEYVVTLFLAIFTLSISVGSYVSDKISDSSIELGLVPIGAAGLSVFLFDLGMIDYTQIKGTVEILNFLNPLHHPQLFRTLMDLGLIGFFFSFFIVPLYALLQHRSKKETCSRVIAANNFLNSIYMVASAGLAIVLYYLGLETEDIFIVISLMNIAVAIYIFCLLPEFLFRLIIWVLAKTTYRLKYTGRELVPKHGAAIVIANHVSFIDWFIVSAACQRPVRFIMDHQIFKIPVISSIFKASKAIPIAPEKEDPECKKQAFKTIASALKNEDAICIFPEGAITRDGKLAQFKKGIEIIQDGQSYPIIIINLKGLWGSYFSRKKGSAMSGIPKPTRRKIQVEITEYLGEKPATAEQLQIEFEKNSEDQ